MRSQEQNRACTEDKSDLLHFTEFIGACCKPSEQPCTMASASRLCVGQGHQAMCRPASSTCATGQQSWQSDQDALAEPQHQQQPNKGILEHNRKREVEILLMQERDRLEEVA